MPPSDAFVRQRRSLLAVSLALILVQVGVIPLENLQILGVKLRDMAAPSMMELALWVLLLYFVSRYFAYVPQRWGIRAACVERLGGYARSEIVKRRSDVGWRLAAGYPRGPWIYEAEAGVEGERERVQLTLRDLPSFPRLRAWTYVLLRQSNAAEFGLPPLLAIVAALIGGVRLVLFAVRAASSLVER